MRANDFHEMHRNFTYLGKLLPTYLWKWILGLLPGFTEKMEMGSSLNGNHKTK